jgi:hypothetical protein
MQEGLDESGPEAAQGTLFHLLVTQVVEEAADPRSFLGKVIEVEGYPVEVDEEMVYNLCVAEDIVADIVCDRIFIESRIPMDHISPEMFGTCDVGWINEDSAGVLDWKYGFVPVYPEENEQLACYMEGLLREQTEIDSLPDDFPITFRIFQPRCPVGGGDWETNLGWLRKCVERLRVAALATYEAEPEANPGFEQCFYCKANRVCSAFQDYIFTPMGITLGDIMSGRSVEKLKRPLTDKQRVAIFRNSSIISKFLSQVAEDLQASCERGAEVPGVKLVQGRNGARQFVDEEWALFMLEIAGHDPYKKVSKTPTQIEHELGKKAFQEMEFEVTQTTGKRTLVLEEDKREKVNLIEQMFEDKGE